MNFISTVAEEKPKLAIGKNGAQVPMSNQMPNLDAEPEKDVKEIIKDIEQTDDIANDKPVETENGKIVGENSKPEVLDEKNEGEIDKAFEPPPPVWVETADGQLEVEDADDYLIYLEDILKRIHK